MLVRSNTALSSAAHNDINKTEDTQMQDNEQLAAGAASDLNAKLCAFYFNERFL